MSQMSDYLEQAIINHIFRGTTFTAPTTLYIALYTAAPSDSGGGTEVSGNAYARVAVTCNTTNWSAPGVGGSTSNSVAITFPTATGSWGSIVAIGILDASSGGNLLIWLTQSSTTVSSGQTAKFDPTTLSVTAA